MPPPLSQRRASYQGVQNGLRVSEPPSQVKKEKMMDWREGWRKSLGQAQAEAHGKTGCLVGVLRWTAGGQGDGQGMMGGTCVMAKAAQAYCRSMRNGTHARVEWRDWWGVDLRICAGTRKGERKCYAIRSVVSEGCVWFGLRSKQDTGTN